PLRAIYMSSPMILRLYRMDSVHVPYPDNDGPAGGSCLVDGLGQPALYDDPLGLLGGLGGMGSRSGSICVAIALVVCAFMDDILGRGCVWLPGAGHGAGSVGQPGWGDALSGIEDSGDRHAVSGGMVAGCKGGY